jgi:hypothetical protein
MREAFRDQNSGSKWGEEKGLDKQSVMVIYFIYTVTKFGCDLGSRTARRKAIQDRIWRDRSLVVSLAY